VFAQCAAASNDDSGSFVSASPRASQIARRPAHIQLLLSGAALKSFTAYLIDPGV